MLLGATPTTLLQPCCALLHTHFILVIFTQKNTILDIRNCYLFNLLSCLSSP